MDQGGPELPIISLIIIWKFSKQLTVGFLFALSWVDVDPDLFRATVPDAGNVSGKFSWTKVKYPVIIKQKGLEKLCQE